MMVTAQILGCAVLGATATAHAGDGAAPRILMLQCAAPADLPSDSGATLRLSCRVKGQWAFAGTVLALVDLSGGPAFWQTLNPFPPADHDQLRDPFGPVRATYVDPFESGRYARPRTSNELRDPFEPAFPAGDDDVSDEP